MEERAGLDEGRGKKRSREDHAKNEDREGAKEKEGVNEQEGGKDKKQCVEQTSDASPHPLLSLKLSDHAGLRELMKAKRLTVPHNEMDFLLNTA